MLHLIRVDLIIVCISWLMLNFAPLTTNTAAGNYIFLFILLFVDVSSFVVFSNLQQKKSIVGYFKLQCPCPSRCSVDREVLFINSQSPQSSVKHPVELPKVSARLQSN